MARKTTTSGMGFYSTIAAHVVTMHCCAMAFVPSVPVQQQHSSICTATRAWPAMSAASPVSRAQLLRVIPAAAGAVVLGGAVAKPVTAALPTSEDYAFGTGSKKQPNRASTSTTTTRQDSADACPNCSLSERRKRAASSSEAATDPSSPEQTKRPEVQDELSAPLPKSSVNPNNPVEVVKAVSGELDRMEALVNKERWGDALTRVRSYPLTTLKSPTLGMGSVSDVARALGVPTSKASDILEASMEAGLTLREVEDVVFSNTRTLEFFNSADYKQVEDLAKNRQPTDLTEPLQLLSDTKKLVDGVTNMMGGASAGVAAQ